MRALAAGAFALGMGSSAAPEAAARRPKAGGTGRGAPLDASTGAVRSRQSRAGVRPKAAKPARLASRRARGAGQSPANPRHANSGDSTPTDR